MGKLAVSEFVFLLTICATFAAAILARRHNRREHVGTAGLNRWLVGLSAGTTANSGFIVTGAVGLGYMYGARWLLLPLSWLLGDILFWWLFPGRINSAGRRVDATTVSELITKGLPGKVRLVISALSGLIILVCLAGYTSAQWLAGQKFLSGAFGLPNWMALGMFSTLIVAYSSIGGFRGSVYTDSLQAIIRIIGTFIAIAAIGIEALDHRAEFIANMSNQSDGFLNLLPGGVSVTAGFVLGYAAAALGFGLGQPQIVSRYLAGRDPAETRSAWWIYIGFVQFTWIAMTGFGMVLRGVMPEIADPETGLSVFFQSRVCALATGIIVADVFATIAATSNGLLIAMAQTMIHDLLPLVGGRRPRPHLWSATAVIGFVTMAISSALHGSVFAMALTSVALMGAGLAPAVMIRILGWPCSGPSLLASMIAGLLSALAWNLSGLSEGINEAAIGLAAGLLTNVLVYTCPRRLAIFKSVRQE